MRCKLYVVLMLPFYVGTNNLSKQNTKNSEVPWGDVDIIMGMATIHTNGNRLARLFVYYFKPKLHPRQLVEITGTQPPMVSWADKEDLEKE